MEIQREKKRETNRSWYIHHILFAIFRQILCQDRSLASQCLLGPFFTQHQKKCSRLTLNTRLFSRILRLQQSLVLNLQCFWSLYEVSGVFCPKVRAIPAATNWIPLYPELLNDWTELHRTSNFLCSCRATPHQFCDSPVEKCSYPPVVVWSHCANSDRGDYARKICSSRPYDP